MTCILNGAMLKNNLFYLPVPFHFLQISSFDIWRMLKYQQPLLFERLPQNSWLGLHCQFGIEIVAHDIRRFEMRGGRHQIRQESRGLAGAFELDEGVIKRVPWSEHAFNIRQNFA